ncbi:MAG: hypothetical protein IJM78_00040 [Prevotella sp.]|jgi:hypothetical protein|nr:hypothetical protein [Prevotella sp.]MBQ6680610.1 hypothetical protein [Prevotella sp.]
MKVVLSRKGVDSQYGKLASPILPDGTLLSLPIPSDDELTYSEIKWNGSSYWDIILSLKSKTTLQKYSHCHLDPDLRECSIARGTGWKQAFGQTGSSLTELRDYGVSVGDLFLFFGWFRETEYKDGGLRYKFRARDLHVIYGYMQIGDIIDKYMDIPDWLKYHPHANYRNYKTAWEKRQNAIYLPSEHLSFAPNLPGAGTFKYDKRYVLTKSGFSRSRWEFPKNMEGIPISHNPNGWKQNYFQSAARGQEFVIESLPSLMEWVNHLFYLT